MIVLFSDPRVFLRALINVPVVPEIVGISVAALFAFACVWSGARSREIGRWRWLLAGFGVASVGRFLLAGIDWQTVVQWMPAYLGAVGAASFGLDTRFIRRMLTALAFAMTLHALTIFVPSDYIRSGLDATTAYGLSSGESDRQTGLTYAPGILSLYSCVGLAIGVIMLFGERRWRWLLLVVASLACGVATLNRSFLMGIAATSLIVPVLRARMGRHVVGSLLIAATLAGSVLWVARSTEYGAMMSERFDPRVMEIDVETRTRGDAGIVPAFEAFARNPLIGSFEFNPVEGRAMVYTGERFVMVHNGFAWTFATRGILFGLVFYYWTAIAGVNLWRETRASDPTHRLHAAALLGGFVAGHAVSFVEAFHETSVMLLPVAIGVAIGFGRRSPKGHGHREVLGVSKDLKHAGT